MELRNIIYSNIQFSTLLSICKNYFGHLNKSPFNKGRQSRTKSGQRDFLMLYCTQLSITETPQYKSP